MAIKTYIGARYAPLFIGEWNKESAYSALSVVYTGDRSFVSRKNVPAGTEITDPEYWVQSSDWNAQVAEYNKNVEQYNQNVVQYNQNVETYKKATDLFFGETVHAYNIKENMVADQSVKLGYTLITCGENSVGDGGGSYYNVVSSTSPTAIALENGLFAQPFKLNDTATEYISIKEYGAIGDGNTDDTSAIQTAINAGAGRTVYIPKGNYLLSKSISILNDIHIILDPDARLFANTDINYLLGINLNEHSYNNLLNVVISGGTFDCNNIVANGIYGYGYHHSLLENARIVNFNDRGVVTKSGGNGAYFTQFNNLLIGNNAEFGFYMPGNDENIINCSVVNCRYGYCLGAHCTCTNCTAWLSNSDLYSTSVAYLIQQDQSALINCTSDTMHTSVKLNTALAHTCMISNFHVIHNTSVVPAASTNSPTIFSSITNTSDYKFLVCGCNISYNFDFIFSTQSAFAPGVGSTYYNVTANTNYMTDGTAKIFDSSYLDSLRYAKNYTETGKNGLNNAVNTYLSALNVPKNLTRVVIMTIIDSANKCATLLIKARFDNNALISELHNEFTSTVVNEKGTVVLGGSVAPYTVGVTLI